MTRKTLLATSILLFSSLLFAQTDKVLNYKITNDIKLVQCDIDGNKQSNEDSVIGMPGQIIRLIDDGKNETKIVRFWVWEKDWELASMYNYVQSYRDKSDFDSDQSKNTKERKYFLMKQSDFESKTKKYYPLSLNPSLSFGTALLPIKLRFNQFDYSKDFTIGPTIGSKWRASRYNENYINLLFGIGITSVTLDSATTQGTILKTSDRSAITPSVGLLFEFENNVQFGIFVGWDLLSSKEQTNWVYDKKPWLSVGLGYSIFNKSAKSNKQKNSEVQPGK